MNNKLLYQTPGITFSEALPMGNGAFGAMVYGGFPNFHYSLNMDTLWSGNPNQKDCLFVKDEIRKKVRTQIKTQHYFEAQKTVQEYMTSQKYNESYLSAGFLDIYFHNLGEQKEYFRELDMDTASVQTSYVSSSGTIKTESFISCADDILMTRITADVPVSVGVRLKSLLKHRISIKDGRIELKGEAPAHVEPDYVDSPEPILYGNGMQFILQTQVLDTDGSFFLDKDLLQIKAAREIVLVTAGVTGFRGWNIELETCEAVLEQECGEKFLAIQKENFYTLKHRHTQVYQPLFRRVIFNLKETAFVDLPIEVRLRRLKHERDYMDKGLYELLFQYGRYLTICASLPGSKHMQPSTLQGIWCEDIRPMWSCNWTININTEMNYWLTGPCALSECDGPLIQMLKEISEAGKTTARDTLGSGGWAACHNLDIWRQTTPVKGMVKWSFWPLGGIWLATHLYTHYLYTGDLEFLEKEAYPILKGAAEFSLGWLYEEDGILHSSPATSPENTFLDQEGNSCAVSDSSTMDIALIREILTETAEVARILRKDSEFAASVKTALEKLPKYRVGQYGQLMEWSKDFKEEDKNHRHFAHLVGFHPFHQIDRDERPGLLKGVETSISRRLEGSKCHIGWVEAWLANFYARLRNGKEAEKHLQLFLKHCVYPNLFGLHPPLGENQREREIFQIDGNFGITAGIAEMLLQSKTGILYLLPALPEGWEQGEITGLRASGGHTVSIKWEKNRLQEAKLQWGRAEQVVVRCKTAFALINQGKDSMISQKIDEDYSVELMGKKDHTCALLLYEI